MTRDRDVDVLVRDMMEAARQETDEGLTPGRAAQVGATLRARIEQEGSGRRRWWTLWLGLPVALAGAAAAIVALTWPSLPPAGTAADATWRVVYRSGHVVRSPTTEPTDDESTSAEEGTRLRLAAGARWDAVDAHGARMITRGPGEVRIARHGVHIADGEVAFWVEPRPANSPLVVACGHARVVVRGTRLAVSATADSLTAVRVQEGWVEVVATPDAEPVIVRAGEAFGEAAASAWSRQELAQLFAEPWWTQPQPGDRVGHLLVRSEPSGAVVHLDRADLGRTPVVVRWQSGAAELRVERRGYLPAEQAVRVLPHRLSRVAIELAPEAETGNASPTAERDPWAEARRLLEERRCVALERRVAGLVAISRDDQERARAHLLSAECALRRGRRHRALAKLDALAQALPDTAAGEAALFETAKLQAELGKPETALATVEHYLKIHPEGRFAEAGSMRRCELLVTLGRRAAARSCLDVYRRRFPNAARRHHAALLLGSLARLEGSYAEAAAAFEEFLALAPGSPHAEEAAYGRAWSLREGRLQGAGAAAAEYVRRYPDGAHADEVRAWLEAAAEGAR